MKDERSLLYFTRHVLALNSANSKEIKTRHDAGSKSILGHPTLEQCIVVVRVAPSSCHTRVR